MIPAVDMRYSARERQSSAESCFRFHVISKFAPEFLCGTIGLDTSVGMALEVRLPGSIKRRRCVRYACERPLFWQWESGWYRGVISSLIQYMDKGFLLQRRKDIRYERKTGRH